MKKIANIMLGTLMLSACTLPDYHEINPKPLKDSPAYNVTPAGAGQKTANGVTYVVYGQKADFGIAVVDAPGKVSDVSGVIAIPSYGTTTTEASSLAALKGQMTGTTKVTFQAAPAPDASDRNVNLDLFVVDSQVDEKGAPANKSTKKTVAITLVTCIDEGIVAGTYKVTAATGVLDGGGAYTLASIEADNGGPINVVVTKTRPGLYNFNEVTGGIWPIYYSTRANPALSVDLCGTVVSGHPGLVTTGGGTTAQRKFTINGTLNGNGTITIVWSYIRETGGATPANPANGTYTLTKI